MPTPNPDSSLPLKRLHTRQMSKRLCKHERGEERGGGKKSSARKTRVLPLFPQYSQGRQLRHEIKGACERPLDVVEIQIPEAIQQEGHEHVQCASRKEERGRRPKKKKTRTKKEEEESASILHSLSH